MVLLTGLGINVSKRQLVRRLIDSQDAFLNAARDVLRTGLDTAPWITVDDTGARHKAQNGVCTQIGNEGAAKPLPSSRPSRPQARRAD